MLPFQTEMEAQAIFINQFTVHRANEVIRLPTD
jgi:hypothetical protein